MTSRRALYLPILVPIVIISSSVSAQVVGPDPRLERASQLLQGNRFEQGVAVSIIRQVGPGNLTPQLQERLINALEREATLVARTMRGEIPELENAELIAGLAQVVASFRNPRAIPALTGALGNSPQAIHALAEFGELAAPGVLQVIRRTSDGSIETDALLTLRFMAEGVGGPLTAATLRGMREVAKNRLTSSQKFITTVWRAIDLAVAVRDTELRAIVHSLASNRHAVLALNNTDEDLITRTQRKAAERLAGVPPLPRHVTADEYARRWE